MTSGAAGRSTGDDVLAHDHHVPLRRQLAAGLEAAIRDGHIGPGSHLPSTREMANRLGLHRSTVAAAYARLRRRGCATSGPGRRTRALGPTTLETRAVARARLTARNGPSLAAAPGRLAAAGIEQVCEAARRGGVGRDAAIGALATLSAVVAEEAVRSRRRVVLFEPRPGLRRILAAELAAGLPLEVESRSGLGGFEPGGAPILIRAELAGRLAGARPFATDVIPLHVAGGTRERGHVRRIVRGGLVTLVSVSGCVRRFARDLAARDFGRGISFVAMAPSDSAAIIRSIEASRLILFDEPSRGRVPSTEVPAVPIRLIPEAQLESLRRYLGIRTRGRKPPVGGRVLSRRGT